MPTFNAVYRIVFVACIALVAFHHVAQAEPIALPAGIKVDPPSGLDVTYQILPSYDESKKVIAGWDGDKLQYYVTLEKLPPGYLDAKVYLSGLASGLRSSWGSLDIHRQATYPAKGGLTATVIEVSSKNGSSVNESNRLVVHFLTDKKSSYVAIVAVVPSAETEKVFNNTVELLQTASVQLGTVSTAPTASNESPFFGVWVCDENVPNDHPYVARLELKSDLSFSTEVRMDSRIAFAAAGAWQKEGGKLHWTYLSSQPSLPATGREDEDEIVSVGTSAMILRSSRTGKEHTYRRVSTSGN